VKSKEFQRIVLSAKNNNQAVSDMLEITDSYEAFCINEAADYIYYSLRNNTKPQESGNSLLKRLAKRK
jgi:hypothetical protein